MKFTLTELAERYAENEMRRESEIKIAEEKKMEEIMSWMTTAYKLDIVIVSSAMAVKTEFNSNLVNLIVGHGCDLDVGFFIGSYIMKNQLNDLIKVSEMIKTLKAAGIQSSTVIDHLLEGICRFC